MTSNPPECRYRTALLVDDSDIDNFLNRKILQAAAFATEIRVASSVMDAIDCLQRVKDGQAERFDVIFIDLNMPVMSGYDFIRHINTEFAEELLETKLAILTSSLYEQDRDRAKQLSAKIVYLNKPLLAGMLDML